jgi:hypothetical protein
LQAIQQKTSPTLQRFAAKGAMKAVEELLPAVEKPGFQVPVIRTTSQYFEA